MKCEMSGRKPVEDQVQDQGQDRGQDRDQDRVQDRVRDADAFCPFQPAGSWILTPP